MNAQTLFSWYPDIELTANVLLQMFKGELVKITPYNKQINHKAYRVEMFWVVYPLDQKPGTTPQFLHKRIYLYT